MTKSSQKSVKIVYFFWNLHTLKCKENLYLRYMNINHEPVATRLMIDFKHQADNINIYYVGYELHFMLEKDVPVLSKRTQCVVPMHPTLGCTGTPFSNSSNCKYLQKYARSTGFREPQM